MPKFYLHTPKSQGDKRLLTRMALSMDEAKQLSILFNFEELSDPSTKDVNRVIKSARKNKLKGDELFWYLQNEL